MVYDPGTGHYVPITWKDAFELFGRVVRGLDDPNQASYYTSGRLGNEATFLYQLMAPELGTNNLPDCSNMCHEASGRALQASLGTGRGTADLKDWEAAAALFIMGVNAASNAPRMLTALAEAYRRGARIVHINPLVEAAATRTIVPHGFLDMALLRGMAKAVLEQSGTDPKALDREFVDRHTTGFVEYRALCENTSWAELERQSGLSRADIVKAARVYCDADRSIFSGAWASASTSTGSAPPARSSTCFCCAAIWAARGRAPPPVRGHSNVQGNRTCGIDHRPTAEFLERLADVCGIDPPRPTRRTPTRRCAAANSPSR
ncbi:hypothetical protein DV517_51210 [Streptomyces sp. S816]|nr:hypothetical protein DV517_51210 [Streptomyces sp. S816]